MRNYGLNDRQLEAVLQTEGPLLILAGAGSGKTSTLTSRIAHIVDSKLARPQEILAITFTNKAAAEMRDRVQKIVGAGAAQMQLSTFHSFCCRVLRQHATALGYTRSFTIYDEDDSQSVVNEIAREMDLSEKYYPRRAVRAQISGAKNTLLTPEEYKQLYNATRERAADPPKPRWKWECEQLHDFVLFMVNTGLRPDEAGRLQFRDVEVVKDAGSKETILEISVRGKRGVGYCKSMPGAVVPFERLRTRKRLSARKRKTSWGGESANSAQELGLPKPTDLLFPDLRAHHLNAVLDEQGLKLDREGLRRSAYSLRHTYICLRLMEGADIYQIAKNCRTSVEMIEKYYAAHIKDSIDADAINVKTRRKAKRLPRELS